MNAYFVIALFVLGVKGSLLPNFEFIQRVQMDQEGNYVLLWTPREKDIVFEVQVKAKGYVGLGFSPNGGMEGADIVIGWVDDMGNVQFSDRHGVSPYDTPVVDKSQDYEVLGGSVNDTHTTLRFSRLWDTCDSNGDFRLTDDTIRVIWAYDSYKPRNASEAPMNHHENRGTKSIFLKEPAISMSEKDDEGLYWDVKAPGVVLPDKYDTLYWCKMYKVPQMVKKHHVIGYRPIIEKAHLANVHHIILYECMLENSEQYMEKYVSELGAQCYTKNMPTSWNVCGSMFIGWAIGSQGEKLPDGVGFPIDEKHGGSTYFLFEIHYDNPTLKSGLVDHSGLRIYLSEELRPIEGGVLTLGHQVNPLMVIPPRMKWPTKGYCASECTAETLPKDGIKVFGAFLHAHLLARSITVQHIRNNIELPLLTADHHYDFNYQQTRMFKPEKIVMPGDELIVTCNYNSMNKNVTTFGGLSTEDEMCLVFLQYYPRSKLKECYSMPSIDLVGKSLGIKKIYNPHNLNLKATFTKENINEVEEEKKLDQMKKSEKAGDQSINLQSKDYLRLFQALEPESIKGTSFYDLLTRDSTWEDEKTMAKVDDAVNIQYEILCQTSGKQTVPGIKTRSKANKNFVPYEEKMPPCLNDTK